MHVVSTVATVWIPLAAELTPANSAYNEVAPALLAVLPTEVRCRLGDRPYNAPNVREVCAAADRLPATNRDGAYPHTNDGVEVRRVFHKLQSVAIEDIKEHFKGIFAIHGSVPANGLRAARRFALGAAFVYQLSLLHRFAAGPRTSASASKPPELYDQASANRRRSRR